MSRHLLVVGDPVADHLLPALVATATESGWTVDSVDPFGLADLAVAADDTTLTVRGRRVDAAVVRLSLELLVAPAFDAEDRSFTANELRAFWAHALSLPTVRTPLRGSVTTSLLRDTCAWREMLEANGVPVAPLHLGSTTDESWWVHWDGTVGPAPASDVARVLGATTVRARAIRTVTCCCGAVDPDTPDSLLPTARRAALVLADEGIGLAQLTIDERGRVLAVAAHAPVRPEHAGWAARSLVAYLEEDLACCS